MQGSLSLSVICLLLSVAAQAQSPTPADDTARADALLKQMTTEEKIGQLNQPFYLKLPIAGIKTDPVPYEERVRRGEVGSFLLLTDPKEINRLQKIAMTEPRLHIPILFGFHLSGKTSPVEGSITATVTVANTEAREGDEVVQLYLHQRFGSASRPVRELKGFRRVALRPGEKKEIKFTVGREERSYWSAATNGWVV